MNKIVLAGLLISLALATVVPRTGPVQSHAPLTYKVQLSDSPKVRWAPIIKDFHQPLARFLDFFDLLPIPKGFFDGVEWFAKNEFKHQDFVAEVTAVAELSGLPFDKLFFLNFMYEFSTFKACTGIVLRNDQGKILHGRNLDFEMWELFSKLVVNVEYYNGSEKVYSVDTVAGSVFALTGIRHGAFSVNVDTRKAKDFSQDLVSVLAKQAYPTVWLVRRVLEDQSNFAAAINRLKTEIIGGPVYFIVAGVGANEGAVIERDTNVTHAFYQLSAETWFLVQTNYDRDEPEPIYDTRRAPVEAKLKERGNKGLNEQVLLDDFMFKWPTFNIATIMTAIISPSASYHNTTVWYGYNPHQSEASSLQTE